MKEIIYERGYIPVLIGSIVEKEYGEYWINELKTYFPDNNSIVLGFIESSELSEYYKSICY